MNIYILENGHKNPIDNSMNWYGKEAFTSQKSLDMWVQNSYEVNKGTNINKKHDSYVDSVSFITYDCLSTDDRQMTVYLRITKLKTR